MRNETLAVVVALSAALVLLTAVLIAIIRMPPASEITLGINAKEGQALLSIKSAK